MAVTVLVVITPSSQGLKPPTNPGRFGPGRARRSRQGRSFALRNAIRVGSERIQHKGERPMPGEAVQVVPSSSPDRHMRVLLSEIYLLLTYIQSVPDRRLTRYFGQGAQRIQERDGAPVPPTWDLTYFLGRIAAIESSSPDLSPNAFTETGIRPPTAPPNPLTTTAEVQAEAGLQPASLATSNLDTGPRMTDLAFLIWTQDFLAAVAAPVTVETLMVTQAFRVARMSNMSSRLLVGLKSLRGTSPMRLDGPAKLPDRPVLSPPQFNPELALTTEQATLQAYGKRLASRVSKLSWVTAAIIFFTVWSSALVYTGRVLVRENATLQAAYRDLATRIALTEKDERAALLDVFKKDGGATEGASVSRTAFYCEISLPPLPTLLKEASQPVPGIPAPSAATDWSPEVRT